MKSSESEGRIGRCECRHAQRAGFTLIEIMLAVAILVIGLLGVLVIFPVAIHDGEKAIQETTASLIAQSVEQSIREGLRFRKAQTLDGKWTYFIFQHDGVEDPLPRRIEDAAPGGDYYILLPETDTESNQRVSARSLAYQSGKVFVFPETDGKVGTLTFDDGSTFNYDDTDSRLQPNGSGNPDRADDDADDDRSNGKFPYVVHKTYKLGAAFFRDVEIGGLDQLPASEIEKIRNAQSYSFAFRIRRAFNDASLGRHFPVSLPQSAEEDSQLNRIIPANELFEVTVMVFRSFRPGRQSALPVFEASFLVAK